jgi:hypothetical protein
MLQGNFPKLANMQLSPITQRGANAMLNVGGRTRRHQRIR